MSWLQSVLDSLFCILLQCLKCLQSVCNSLILEDSLGGIGGKLVLSFKNEAGFTVICFEFGTSFGHFEIAGIWENTRRLIHDSYLHTDQTHMENTTCTL